MGFAWRMTCGGVDGATCESVGTLQCDSANVCVERFGLGSRNSRFPLESNVSGLTCGSWGDCHVGAKKTGIHF